MLRDNLADSSRTMINLGRCEVNAARKTQSETHRTDRSLCLENPRPKGGIFLPFGETLALIFTLNQNRAAHTRTPAPCSILCRLGTGGNPAARAS